jgi:Protein of unknown function (DUF429)
MHYCGIVPAQRALQLAMLEEVRAPEPPIRLSAIFFEPGSATQVAEELRSLGDVVVGLGVGGNAELTARGVAPQAPHPEVDRLVDQLGLPVFTPGEDGQEGPVPEGAYQESPVFETNADGVFCALQGRRLPAKRHPYGMQLRIEELAGDRVTDEGGDLWHRRMEELDAVACALCAHRYALGHACWLGNVVLPGRGVPETFRSSGVLPPVERLQLPPDRPE